KSHPTYYHIVFLILTLLPIIFLSKRVAKIIDFGIVEIGAPVALGGIIIAFIVLIPESMAALSSARANQLQRSINLLLGSALSTIGLTLPAVLAVSLISNESLILGLDMAPMVLLLLTLVVCSMTFSSARTNIMQGAVHLVLFFAYLLLVLNP
ncbi:TPA: calcium:proton antiporter, partial [Vibrio alginolyticus]|nr:calcium:proton antiporter [Vibrio alginolyticus]HCZ8841235.1 calcium:proton antiporter [Vibrio alginolyticus]HCZ8947336.1 calcium:proton antiporter [Vibrio alginolyticus]HCZ8952371.1 calcium:proton antiporter [Vibrio alginolyticus]HCZ8957526.1 calcium:proton antiporter [Vibrio alginolyticus]